MFKSSSPSKQMFKTQSATHCPKDFTKSNQFNPLNNPLKEVALLTGMLISCNGKKNVPNDMKI